MCSLLYNVRARCPEILDTACIARPRSISCLLNWIRNGFFIPWMYVLHMRRYTISWLWFGRRPLAVWWLLTDYITSYTSTSVSAQGFWLPCLPRRFPFPMTNRRLVSLCPLFFQNNKQQTHHHHTTTQQQKNGWHFGLWFLYNRRKNKRQEIRFRRHLFSIIPRVGKNPNVHMYTMCCCIHPSIGKADEIRKKVKNIFFFFLCLAFLLGWMLLAHVSSPAANFYLLLLLIFPPHLFFSFFLKTT